MHQDGQKQSVIDVAGVEQRRPSRYSRSRGIPGTKDAHRHRRSACAYGSMDRFEPIRVGGEGFADGVVVLRDGGDRREPGRAAVVETLASDLTKLTEATRRDNWPALPHLSVQLHEKVLAVPRPRLGAGPGAENEQIDVREKPPRGDFLFCSVLPSLPA
jgi:hypothetical protein